MLDVRYYDSGFNVCVFFGGYVCLKESSWVWFIVVIGFFSLFCVLMVLYKYGKNFFYFDNLFVKEIRGRFIKLIIENN